MKDPEKFNLGCLKRDWKGVKAFHLTFNKVMARGGSAQPLHALQAFHSTPTIYWSLSTGFTFPRHTGGITERTEGKAFGIVLETLPVQRLVSFPSCPPHDVMATAGHLQLCPEPLWAAPRLGCILLTCTQPQECFNCSNFPPPAQTWHLSPLYTQNRTVKLSFIPSQTLSGSAQ